MSKILTWWYIEYFNVSSKVGYYFWNYFTTNFVGEKYLAFFIVTKHQVFYFSIILNLISFIKLIRMWQNLEQTFSRIEKKNFGRRIFELLPIKFTLLKSSISWSKNKNIESRIFKLQPIKSTNFLHCERKARYLSQLHTNRAINIGYFSFLVSTLWAWIHKDLIFKPVNIWIMDAVL